jgi:nucleoside-diphosphate kinase
VSERTLVLVKPDGVQRGLTGEVLTRFEDKGFRVVALKMLRMDMDMARRHYAEHLDKPFFNDLAAFITSGPLVALVLEGPGAVATVRQMMGATDPAKSPPGTIRGDLGLTIGMNIVHGSDSPARAVEEIGLFFAHGEVLDYTRDVERWILEG